MLGTITALLIATAALPDVLVTQVGRLLDGSDRPMSGEQLLRVRFWDDDGATASALWDQTYSAKLDADGVYSIVLGDTVNDQAVLPASLFANNASLWMSVTIGGQELLPRLRVGTVPNAGYAQHAGDAATLGGLALTDLDARYARIDPDGPQPGALHLAGDVTTDGSFVGDGSKLSNLDATSLVGTIADANLSSNVATLAADETFAGHVTFTAPLSTGAMTATGTVIATAFQGDGSLLTAIDATTWRGLAPTDFLAAGATAVDAAKLGGKDPSAYLASDAQAVDSAKLGGKDPSAYLAFDAQAVDSAKLEGHAASDFQLVGAPLVPATSRPSNPTAGTMVWNDSTGALEVFDGSAWTPVASRPAPGSCLEILQSGASHGDGVYSIQPTASAPAFDVYCDMTTRGGGWTLVAASAGDTNMPKFTTTASTPCTSASPSSPCFLGAANLAALRFSEFAWSTTPAAVATVAPLSNMRDGGAPDTSAICVNENEYFRFNQDSAAQGMGWTGCTPSEIYEPTTFCPSAIQPEWNLLSCSGLLDSTPFGSRSSPDFNCSPFGRYTSACTDFRNVRHWRR